MSNVYARDYDVNFSDIDYNNYCKVVSLVGFLCDSSTRHAALLGDTTEELLKKGYAWVFYNYDIKINRYPKYCEKINIETRVVNFTRFYAIRSYRIIDQNQQLIGEATAVFFLIDFQKRRPIRIPKEEFEIFDVSISDIKSLNIDKIEEVSNKEKSKKFNVELEYIDSNKHVTNTRYIEWAINSTDIEILENYILKRLKIIYEKEVVLGETVTCYVDVREEDENNIYCIYNILNEEGKCVNKLKIYWERK